MVTLRRTLNDWQTESFATTLKTELEELDIENLPLTEAASCGGLIDGRNFSVLVLSSDDESHRIRTKVGIFCSEIVGGCSCGDDPFVQNIYCEIKVYIDKLTAEAEFAFDSG